MAEAEYTSNTPDADPEAEPEAEAGSTIAPALSEPSQAAHLYTWIALYSVCILLILVLNSIVIIGIIKRKDGFRRNPMDLFLTSLIISRMFIGFFIVPARITGLFSEQYLGSVLCKLCHFVGIGSSTTSILSTTAIAILKFDDIVLCGKKKNVDIVKKKPLLQIAVIWITGYIYSIRTPIIYDLVFVEDATGVDNIGLWLCTVPPNQVSVGRQFVFVDLVCLFLIPGITISFSYFFIVRKITKQKAKLTSQQHDQTFETNNKEPVEKLKTCPTYNEIQHPYVVPLPNKSNKIITPQQKDRVMKIVIWVAFLFFFCNAFAYGLKLYLFYSTTTFPDVDILEAVVYLINYSNGWMNAIVILYYRKDIRDTAWRYLRRDSKVNTVKSYTDEKHHDEEEDRDTFGLG